MVSAEFKKKADHMLLALGLSLMIGIMVLGQDFREALGRTADAATPGHGASRPGSADPRR